jgi:hypothetical protein
MPVIPTKYGPARWVGDGNPEHSRHLTIFKPPKAKASKSPRASRSNLGLVMPAICGSAYILAPTWKKALAAKGKECGLCARFAPGARAQTKSAWVVSTYIPPRPIPSTQEET